MSGLAPLPGIPARDSILILKDQAVGMFWRWAAMVSPAGILRYLRRKVGRLTYLTAGFGN
jgi:hypothetical protein